MQYERFAELLALKFTLGRKLHGVSGEEKDAYRRAIGTIDKILDADPVVRAAHMKRYAVDDKQPVG